MNINLKNSKDKINYSKIYMVIFIVIISFLTSCVSEIEDLSEEEKLYYYKSKNINIEKKLKEVTERIDLKDKYKMEKVEIKSTENPFEINVMVDLKYGKVAQKDDFLLDSALIFSLFDDLDLISYYIVDETEDYFIFSREEIDKKMIEIFGQSSTELGSSLNNFTKLFKYSQIVKNNNNDILIDSHIGDLIESNIKKLGNKNFYEKEEYKKIIQEEGSLDYILEQFIKKNIKNDLRGHILKYAAVDLLGPINNVENWEELDPLDWYKKLEISMPVKINDFIEHDNEYKKLVYKAHYDKMRKKGFMQEDSFTIIGIDIKGIYENNDYINIYTTTRCINALLFEDGKLTDLLDNVSESIVVYEKINGRYNFKEIIYPSLKDKYDNLINELIINDKNIEKEFMNISYDKLNEDLENSLNFLMERNNIKKFNTEKLIK